MLGRAAGNAAGRAGALCHGVCAHANSAESAKVVQIAAQKAIGSGFDGVGTAVEVSVEVPFFNKNFVFDGFRAEDQEKMRKIAFFAIACIE